MIYTLLRKIVRVEKEEVSALCWSCAFFFCLLANNYILRAYRDALGASGRENVLSWLYLGTLAGTLIVNPILSLLVSRYSRRVFLPFVYRFLMLMLLGFYALFLFLPLESAKQAGSVFFVWASVFNLIQVSLFWSFMADLFRENQGRRLFGFISAGGTLGAIAGSTFTIWFAQLFQPVHLVLIAAVLLEFAVFCMKKLNRIFPEESRSEMPEAKRPDILAGIKLVSKSPYLLGICAYILLYSLCATFLYFEQAKLAADSFKDEGEKIAFFARIDLYVNVLGIGLGAFLTGRLIRWVGVGATLAVLPFICAGGFAFLGFNPTIEVIMWLQVFRRSTDYSVSKPAREVLFTIVSRQEKYTAKNLIDTFIYRAGDALGAWTSTGLRALSFGTSGVAFLAVPLSLVWAFNSFWLGKKQKARSESTNTERV